MKIRHISTLFMLLFVFSITGFSQVEDEEVQLFSFGNESNTRSIASNVHDFGVIKKTGKRKIIIKIEIENKGKTTMEVGEIFIPEDIGVTVIKRKVQPGQKAEILVTINPKYMSKGGFKGNLSITTHTDAKGVKVSKTAVYGLKGKVL